jgi:hypothetical protein
MFLLKKKDYIFLILMIILQFYNKIEAIKKLLFRNF